MDDIRGIGFTLAYVSLITMLKFLEFHSAAIQAACSALGLIGLAVYTCLTSSIRKATVRQAKASQRPLIVFELVSDKESKWLIYNRGNGPALHVYWKIGHANDKQNWHNLGALAVNDWSDLPDQSNPRLLTMP
ncbi:hypothetical protein [Edaphobacter aggregans]|uniref:hypothetical protein n=1 Tax=Edaphobacter aggregans TaxID=570835 RepID=UPI000557FEED|nr:hypothetical protein [Edaphobacter aggregans]